MLLNNIKNSLIRGCLQIVSRPLYLISMIVIPLFSAFFFTSLMQEGVADRVPSAVVDLDNTHLSRSLVRTLQMQQTMNIEYKLNSYTEALDHVKEGKIMGFYIIPAGFGSESLAGRKPELSYYINFAYYVPGSLLVKGFQTTSVLANAGLVSGTLTSVGVSSGTIAAKLMPYKTQVHPLNNPWTNYSVYLSNSFVPGLLALMILLATAYTITIELKTGTSRNWLETSGGSMLVGLFGKLFPQTVIFTLVGWMIQGYFYGYLGYPMNGCIGNMMLAMFLLVIATQSFALFVCEILPNPRMGLSVCSLLGILAFSVCGYSFPVESMYSGIAIFSYILPIRYYFLIYIDQALNGIGFAYSANYYAALLVFTLLPFTMWWRLKKYCQNPVYIP